MWSYAVGAVENAAYWPGNYTDVRGHWDNIMPVVLRNVASQWSHLQRSKKSLDSIQMALDALGFQHTKFKDCYDGTFRKQSNE